FLCRAVFRRSRLSGTLPNSCSSIMVTENGALFQCFFVGALSLRIIRAMPPDFRDIDPRELRVPSSRISGADPAKLHRQIAQFGRSTAGMPPLWVYEAADRALVVYYG